MEAVQSMNRKMRDQREIDWEQRRYEIAKDMMQAQISNPTEFSRCIEVAEFQIDATLEEQIAKYSVDFADALIKELQKS